MINQFVIRVNAYPQWLALNGYRNDMLPRAQFIFLKIKRVVFYLAITVFGGAKNANINADVFGLWSPIL